MTQLPFRKIERNIFYLLLLIFPIQLGKHFWPSFSFVAGLRLDYLSPTLYITDVFIFLLFCLNIENFLVFLKKIFRKSLFPAILALTLILGIVLSENPQAGWYGFLKLFEMIFFGWVVYKFFTEDKKFLQITFLIFSWGIIYESIIAIWQFLAQKSIGGPFYFLGERTFSGQTPGIANASLSGNLILRPYATFPHPNVLAAYLLIFMTYIMFFKTKQNQVLKTSAFVVGSVALLLSLSRIAIILWAATLVVKTFSKRKIFIIVGVCLSLLFLTPLGSRFSISTQDESIVAREKLIAYSFQISKRNFLYGVGLNNFYNSLSHIQKTSSAQLSSYLQPVHNVYLLVLAQAGVVGLIYFLSVLYQAFKKSSKKITAEPFFVMLCSLAVLSMFDHYFLTIQQGQLLFALVVGMSFAL